MSTFTPGPWRATTWDGTVRANGEFTGTHAAVFSEKNTMICPTGLIDDESRANARLIAAAPELLAFAKAMTIDFISDEKRIETALAVIAKAGGSDD